MPTFAAAATGAVIISTVIMLTIFSRFKLLNMATLAAVTIASLISIAAFPLLFGLIARLNGGSSGTSALLRVSVLTLASFPVLAFLLSILIALVIPKPGKKAVHAGTESLESESPAVEAASSAIENTNYLEQIYDKLVNENNRETLDNAETKVEPENNLEISVDSSENIDKMGIENIVQNSKVPTIEGCIEEAFKLKETDDVEGAILYFMDALDKNPCKELTFWIVLDICVLYKNLGQAELAYDILNSYHDAFGDLMDATVKEEIESNLLDIRA
jgi:hypothetical protein